MEITQSPYRERLRVLLILYFFSEDYVNEENASLVKVFRSEVKIQKIDFLIRYPSYLCFELLQLYEDVGRPDFATTRRIVSTIFMNNEPQLKTDEMRRFFYGAYEELDNVISFLSSIGLVVFQKKKNVALKDIQKEYFLTAYAVEVIEKGLSTVAPAQWYFDRCAVIKQFFGDLAGSELKNRQYAIEEYRDTPLGTYILDIEHQVKEKYQQLFGQSL